jgi:PAS domain S-box-containing protein
MLQSDMNQSNILVVDDKKENLLVLRQILKKQGYNVQTANNGQAALEAAQATPPDLVLLDIMMPGMKGYEVCRHLKTGEKTRDIPVIFITALSETEDKLKGFEAGGVDYITKPFQPKEVVARVKAHLTIRHLQQQFQQECDRFRGLSEATFEGIVIHDQGNIIEVNQAIATMLGYSREDLIGKNILEFVPSEYHEMALHKIQTNDETPYELEAKRKDGSIFPIEIQAKIIHWQGHKVRMSAVRDITWRRKLEQENLTLKATLSTRDHFGLLVGESPAIHKIYERIASAAASDDTIIIYGETGTGKELVARTIFELSEQHTKNFVPVNCGAIQETLFEPQFFGYRKGAFTGAERDTLGYFDQARGGTLFLDEVGELTLTMQAKLLRVLQDGEYTPVGATTSRTADVRIIAATNRELRELVQEGKVREDFFHRLHVIALNVPPLRWRKEDIPLLITHFLAQRSSANETPPTIPGNIVEQLLAYDWPGNVRELFNELRRYLTTGELELSGAHLARPDRNSGLMIEPDGRTFNDIIEEVEKHLIANALVQHNGNKVKTAETLQIPLRSLHRKIKKYQL